MTNTDLIQILKKMPISEQLAYLRMKYKFKNIDLAAKSGISTQHITNVQKSTRPINSVQLEDLAAAMGFKVVLMPLDAEVVDGDDSIDE